MKKDVTIKYEAMEQIFHNIEQSISMLSLVRFSKDDSFTQISDIGKAYYIDTIKDLLERVNEKVAQTI